MIVNKCYDTIIVLYLSTILTEKGLDKNMKIKLELTGNRVLERLAGLPPEPTPSATQCQFRSYAPAKTLMTRYTANTPNA